MGALARAEGDFDRAAGYFQRYADEHPDEPESFTSLASLQRLQGDFEGAKTTYERALLLEPRNVGVKVSLATLERHLGRMESGLTQLDEALGDAQAAQDSVRVLTALGSLAEQSGRMSQAVIYLEQRLAVSQSFRPPIQLLSQQLGVLDTYVAAGQIDRARMILEGVEQQLQAPFDQLGWMGHLAIAVELEDADAIEAAIPGVEALIAGLGVETLRPAVLQGTARVLELRERCGEAIPIYLEALDVNPTATSVHLDIGRCHRQLGDLDEAEESIRQGLISSPYDPKMHYELALVFADRGDSDQAVAHLETALSVWENADANFAPAERARSRLAELRR